MHNKNVLKQKEELNYNVSKNRKKVTGGDVQSVQMNKWLLVPAHICDPINLRLSK